MGSDTAPRRFPEFTRHALPDPLFKINRFSLSSWNSASLFGTLRNTGPRQSTKRRYVDELLQADSVVALQETQGCAADLSYLPDSHRYYGAFLEEGRRIQSGRDDSCGPTGDNSGGVGHQDYSTPAGAHSYSFLLV